MTRQTIYCFIPIMDLYAAYHIKKLRWYLLIFLGVTIPFNMALGVVYPMSEIEEYDQRLFFENQEIDWGYVALGDNYDNVVITLVIQMTVAFSLAVYLIRRWSKKWNLQFDNPV